MKMTGDKWPVTSDMTAAANGNPSRHPSPVTRHGFGFTLIELLVVISIMAVLAGFTFPVLKMLKRQQYLKAAQAELNQIEAALENYKARYGAYPPGNPNSAVLNQLYYELSGTTTNIIGGANYFVTLDGNAQILASSVPTAFGGVGGFVNCTKGSGEDAASAKNFLPGLRQNRIYYPVTNNTVATTMLVTSVGGPDQNYQPLNAPGLNPFRYTYPGTNSPNSYDLWVQLVISGKTNLICNWTKQVQINSPLP